MRRRLNLDRYNRSMQQVGIFVIALALIAGMIGCQAAPGQYELTIWSSAGGNVITPGEGTFTVDNGTVVDLVAEADVNYYFVQWTGDVDTVADVEADSTTITVEGDYTITAEFGFDPQQVIEYDLTVSSTVGGSVTVPGEGVFPYDEDTVVDLVAEADEGYYFVNWTGDVDTIGNNESDTTTITMEGDYSIIANFEEIPVGQFSLNTSSSSGGSVTDPGEGTYLRDAGSSVDLVAEADPCYEFVGWSGDVEEIDDPSSAITTITMNDNYTVVANFELVEYDLAINSTSGGSVMTPGEGTFKRDCGAVVDLVAEAEQYYEFVEWTGDIGEIANPFSDETTIAMYGNYVITASFEFKVEPMVAAGGYHTVGLKADGTVVATGLDDDGQCEVDDWEYMVQIAAGEYHTVGLKSDGTVVAVGSNASGQLAVGDWEDIVQVAAGDSHTVALKSDGSVVAVGADGSGQLDVGNWEDIDQVAAGGYHTVGLKEDGTVLAAGDDYFDQCQVGDWEDIDQVAAGGYHTLGLQDDGTVVVVGNDWFEQDDVGDWADILQVAAGEHHTVGLESAGTVVAVGRDDKGQLEVGDWEDVVQVAAGLKHTVALKSDGSVVAAGLDDDGQLDVDLWDLS